MMWLNSRQVLFETFPNGETRVKTDGLMVYNQHNRITFKYENDTDLIRLMFLKKWLGMKPCDLTILYMPYSRMDRSENGSMFTLKYVTEFINDLMFDSITVLEPHSDVTPALLDNARAEYINYELVDTVKRQVKFNDIHDYLFFPDAGAQKRYSKMEGNILVGYKERDFATGKIKSLDVVGKIEEGRKVIIVDDLSSYGGTFMMSAKRLKQMGAGEIYLLVAHCEKSIFEGEIFKTNLIDKVFTTNSIMDHYTAELTDGRMFVFEVD